METQDSTYIEKIIRDRRLAHEALLASGSRTYKAFLEMEAAAFADGRLEKRNKELIALGISIAVNCESCMEWHLRQAQKAGATREQILEAVDVAVEMAGGPATVATRFALKVLEYYSADQGVSPRPGGELGSRRPRAAEKRPDSI
jgi:AhpD family alkylhydroperoxidase